MPSKFVGGRSGFSAAGGLFGERLPTTPPNFITIAKSNSYMGPVNSGDGILHSIIRACIERIMSRTMAAKFEAKSSKDKQRILDNPAGNHGKLAFYRQLYEQLLTTGNALVYKDMMGNRRVGITTGSTYEPSLGVWRVRTSVHSTSLLHFDAEDEESCVHFYLGYKEGDRPHLVQSPVDSIVDALLLYDKGRALLLDYAHRGHKVSLTVAGVPGLHTADRGEQQVNLGDIADSLKEMSGNFGVLGNPPEVEVKSPGKVDAPSEEGMKIALEECARVYGVPMEMLQARDERTEYANVDDHLMSDAVYPVLDMVQDGFARHLKTEVRLKPLSALRAVLGSNAKNIMQLAQTGILTINENREMLDLDEIEGGDEFPQPAGSGYQPDNSSENGRPKKGMENMKSKPKK